MKCAFSLHNQNIQAISHFFSAISYCSTIKVTKKLCTKSVALIFVFSQFILRFILYKFFIFIFQHKLGLNPPPQDNKTAVLTPHLSRFGLTPYFCSIAFFLRWVVYMLVISKMKCLKNGGVCAAAIKRFLNERLWVKVRTQAVNCDWFTIFKPDCEADKLQVGETKRVI